MTAFLRPLTEWPAPVPGQLLGILTDIDDTLTTDGAITPDALQALGALKASGLHVIPITGRPVGWSEPFAATWPVDAIVAENGAVALQRSAEVFDQKSLLPNHSKREQLSKIYQQDAAMRARNFEQLQRAAARVLREVPGSALAQDSPGRETDIAIDHSEFSRLDEAQIAQAVAVMQAEGLHATVSSIHINGWIGTHDKWQGACWIARELLDRDLPAEAERWVYVGDSTNDQVMFEHLPQSVGVANMRRFESKLKYLPRYITRGERGAGFAEVARALLADRT